MRLFSLLTALLVMVSLYLLIFERDRLFDIAGRAPAPPPDAGATLAAEAPPGPAEAHRVSVVAVESRAAVVDRAVLVRGQTEAARQVVVSAETSGRIVSEPLRKGAFVAEGQLLCEIDAGTRLASLAEAQARLAEARAGLPAAEARAAEAAARLEEARILDTAAARLSEGGFASETRVASTRAALSAAEAGVESARSGRESAQAAVQAAEAGVALAEREIARLRVEAPFSGLLETDTAELGELMQPGAACATVIQLDPIKVVGFVPEAEVERVTLGAPAGARLVSGGTVRGAVTFISRSADPQTRTFRIEVEVPNPDLALRDGQTAEIAIASEGAAAHLVPASALTLDDGGRLGLRLAIADPEKGDVAGFVPVTFLRDSTEGVYVTGLPEVARIITVGQEYVTDGVAVGVTLAPASAVDVTQ
jgi:multidrug efflux system membrane fusion protein